MIKKQEIESYLNAGFIGLSKIYPLTNQAIEELKSIAKPIILKKGDKIVQIGDILEGIYFMVKGLGRSYTYRGKSEITSWIIQEGEPFGNYRSYTSGVPSRECTEILEPGLAFYLPKQALVKIYLNNPCVAAFIIILNERNFVKMDDHTYNLLFRTIEERYQIFVKEYPSLINRMKLKDIASYLNMSAETLSRIRQKISVAFPPTNE